MKMQHYSRWHSVLIILTGMSALSACVNEEYDLSKDIDTEITILKNVSMPLGSIEPVTIEKSLIWNKRIFRYYVRMMMEISSLLLPEARFLPKSMFLLSA